MSYETSLRLWIGSDAVPATKTDHLVVPSSYTGHSRSTVKLHQLTLEPDERTLAVPNTRPGEPHFAQLPSATAARSVLDFARRRRRDDAVVIADTALRVGAVTQTALTSGLASLVGLPHVEQARTAVLLSRSGTDSAMETLTRLRLVDAGLPCPTVDYRIVSPTGVLLARGELVYDAFLVWIEYDGYADHMKRHVFRAERRRHRWLESRGWKVVRCVDVDIFDSRSDFVGDVAAALADAPFRIAALSPTLSPEAVAARAGLGLAV